MQDIITSRHDVPYNSYFVLLNDTFCSKLAHKINTLVFSCDTVEQASIVAHNALHRTDTSHVRIISGFRLQQYHWRWSSHMYQLKTQESYPDWYVKDYFKREE